MKNKTDKNMKKITFDDMPDAISGIMEEIGNLRKEVTALSETCNKMAMTETNARLAELYNTKQVASYLNVSVNTIYKMVNEGRIPYLKAGHHLQFSRDEIKAWLKERSHLVVAKTKEDVKQAAAKYRKPIGL